METAGDPPENVVPLILEALAHAEKWMKRRLENKSLDEDERADIINDLSFADSVTKHIQQEMALSRQSTRV